MRMSSMHGCKYLEIIMYFKYSIQYILRAACMQFSTKLQSYIHDLLVDQLFNELLAELSNILEQGSQVIKWQAVPG